ncbi:pol, partial [Symbiodinium sp. CCMP2592]
ASKPGPEIFVRCKIAARGSSDWHGLILGGRALDCASRMGLGFRRFRAGPEHHILDTLSELPDTTAPPPASAEPAVPSDAARAVGAANVLGLIAALTAFELCWAFSKRPLKDVDTFMACVEAKSGRTSGADAEGKDEPMEDEADRAEGGAASRASGAVLYCRCSRYGIEPPYDGEEEEPVDRSRDPAGGPSAAAASRKGGRNKAREPVPMRRDPARGQRSEALEAEDSLSWHVMPKLHQFQHICESKFNAKDFWCYADETLGGHLAQLFLRRGGANNPSENCARALEKWQQIAPFPAVTRP